MKLYVVVAILFILVFCSETFAFNTVKLDGHTLEIINEIGQPAQITSKGKAMLSGDKFSADKFSFVKVCKLNGRDVVLTKSSGMTAYSEIHHFFIWVDGGRITTSDLFGENEVEKVEELGDKIHIEFTPWSGKVENYDFVNFKIVKNQDLVHSKQVKDEDWYEFYDFYKTECKAPEGSGCVEDEGMGYLRSLSSYTESVGLIGKDHFDYFRNLCKNSCKTGLLTVDDLKAYLAEKKPLSSKTPERTAKKGDATNTQTVEDKPQATNTKQQKDSKPNPLPFSGKAEQRFITVQSYSLFRDKGALMVSIKDKVTGLTFKAVPECRSRHDEEFIRANLEKFLNKPAGIVFFKEESNESPILCNISLGKGKGIIDIGCDDICAVKEIESYGKAATQKVERNRQVEDMPAHKENYTENEKLLHFLRQKVVENIDTNKDKAEEQWLKIFDYNSVGDTLVFPYAPGSKTEAQILQEFLDKFNGAIPQSDTNKSISRLYYLVRHNDIHIRVSIWFTNKQYMVSIVRVDKDFDAYKKNKEDTMSPTKF